MKLVPQDIKYLSYKLDRLHPPLRLLLTFSVLCLLGIVVFRDFFFGSKVLLYKDIGSDSLNFFYPMFVHFSDYVRKTGLPLWSFNFGMGQSVYLYIGYLVLDPVTWLPKHAIAEAMVYQHLIKIVAAGMLFFGFLEMRGLKFPAALTGAMLLAFSGYMCLGGCWYIEADEVVAVTFLLFAAEKAVSRGRWFCLPFAVVLVGLVHIFLLYLTIVMLCFYIPARLIELHGWKWKPLPKACAVVASITLLGIGLGSVALVGQTMAVLNSPRGSAVSSSSGKLASTPIFHLETRLNYVTEAYRAFSTDLLGTGNFFRGSQNYFEAPAIYCGLVCLLFLPHVFIGAAKRQQLIYALFFALIAIPMVFPWFRYLFWVFHGDYYRTLGLFAVFGVITLSMTALNRYAENGTFNVWVLGGTLLMLLGTLYLPGRMTHVLADLSLRRVLLIFLLAYAVLFTVGHYLRYKRVFTWLIIALCAAELCKLGRLTVSFRPTVTKQELKQRVGYNDRTADAVRDIHAAEAGFYRLTKVYSSSPSLWDRSLNDALVFSYYGTSAYSSFNNSNYIEFLIAVGAQAPSTILGVVPSYMPDTHWTNGLNGPPALLRLACEKYILTKDPAPYATNSDYQKINTYGDIYLFENRLVLPFGLFYDTYLPEKQFATLSPVQKEAALEQSVVLSETDANATSGLARTSLNTRQNPTTVPGNATTARRSNALQIHSFSQNRIEGTMQCKAPGIVLLQTPFDSGWRAFVDGQRVATVKADIGLLGVKLPEGEHHIELRYLPPFFLTSAVLSGLSLLIFSLCMWRWPRLSFGEPPPSHLFSPAA